jgi:hypothetical protein
MLILADSLSAPKNAPAMSSEIEAIKNLLPKALDPVSLRTMKRSEQSPVVRALLQASLNGDFRDQVELLFQYLNEEDLRTSLEGIRKWERARELSKQEQRTLLVYERAMKLKNPAERFTLIRTAWDYPEVPVFCMGAFGKIMKLVDR